jgi:hypothetical protein
METMIVYVMVKFPLYAYESLHDMKEAWPHYQRRAAAIRAKLRRKISWALRREF